MFPRTQIAYLKADGARGDVRKQGALDNPRRQLQTPPVPSRSASRRRVAEVTSAENRTSAFLSLSTSVFVSLNDGGVKFRSGRRRMNRKRFNEHRHRN